MHSRLLPCPSVALENAQHAHLHMQYKYNTLEFLRLTQKFLITLHLCCISGCHGDWRNAINNNRDPFDQNENLQTGEHHRSKL